MNGNSVTDHGAPAAPAVTETASHAQTAAERARRYRKRKKASGNGSWPPFEPGNEVSLVHGARSERHIEPIAAQILNELLTHPTTPPYLQEPSYAPVLAAWARAEAIVRLLWDFIDQQDLGAAMTDLATTDEDETHRKGSSSRHTVARRVESALTQLHRHETRAMNLRTRLGLDPLSRGRLAKDVTSARFDLARMYAEMQAADAAGAGK